MYCFNRRPLHGGGSGVCVTSVHVYIVSRFVALLRASLQLTWGSLKSLWLSFSFVVMPLGPFGAPWAPKKTFSSTICRENWSSFFRVNMERLLCLRTKQTWLPVIWPRILLDLIYFAEEAYWPQIPTPLHSRRRLG